VYRLAGLKHVQISAALMQHSLQPQPHLLIVTDGRCSQAVLAFLSTTDVGRLVPAEEDVGSEVSEWGAQGAQEAGGGTEAEELGAGEELLLPLPTPSFMASTEE